MASPYEASLNGSRKYSGEPITQAYLRKPDGTAQYSVA